jgi:hypothetical protein
VSFNFSIVLSEVPSVVFLTGWNFLSPSLPSLNKVMIKDVKKKNKFMPMLPRIQKKISVSQPLDYTRSKKISSPYKPVTIRDSVIVMVARRGDVVKTMEETEMIVCRKVATTKKIMSDL